MDAKQYTILLDARWPLPEWVQARIDADAKALHAKLARAQLRALNAQAEVEKFERLIASTEWKDKVLT